MVMVRTFVGSLARQVRIIGEAIQPRTMPFREGMTVVDAIIEARGLTRHACGRKRAPITPLGRSSCSSATSMPKPLLVNRAREVSNG